MHGLMAVHIAFRCTWSVTRRNCRRRVMSERAVAHGYTRSMFQRLQAIGHPVQASPSCPCICLHCCLRALA